MSRGWWGGTVWWEEHLPSMCETLGSIPRTTKTNIIPFAITWILSLPKHGPWLYLIVCSYVRAHVCEDQRSTTFPLLLLLISMCVCEECVPQCPCEGQGTDSLGWFSPPTLCGSWNSNRKHLPWPAEPPCGLSTLLFEIVCLTEPWAHWPGWSSWPGKPRKSPSSCSQHWTIVHTATLGFYMCAGDQMRVFMLTLSTINRVISLAPKILFLNLGGRGRQDGWVNNGWADFDP